MVQKATKRDRPLRLYICTRKPPPPGELERFVRTHQPQSPSNQFNSALESIRTHKVELRHVPLDLLNPTSIRDCASKFLAQESKLDVLVLNAAIAPNEREPAGFLVPPADEESGYSYEEPLVLEKAMMTNVIGTAMLAKLLEPALVIAAKYEEEKPRVVLVSSELHRRLGDMEGKRCSCVQDLKTVAGPDGYPLRLQSLPIRCKAYLAPKSGRACRRTS